MPNLKILNSQADLRNGLYGLVLDQINGRLRSSISGIENKVRDLVAKRLREHRTYRELSTTSKLTAMFGFTSGAERQTVDAVIDEILSGIFVGLESFRITGAQIKGSLTILVDWGYAFNGKSGIIITDRGHKLDWIRWLLLDGSKLVVPPYAILYIPEHNFSHSRSGPALTIKSDNTKLVRRIEPSFSGDYQQNWITESLNDDYSAEFSQIIFSYL